MVNLLLIGLHKNDGLDNCRSVTKKDEEKKTVVGHKEEITSHLGRREK